jgi:hypothetical protein
MMFSEFDNPAVFPPSYGFVVAMRAALLDPGRPSSHEWVIVSRWGGAGEYLSIGWTETPALTADAPINLTPLQTAFATCPGGCGVSTPTTFELAASLPGCLRVAGDFVPAQGFVQLYGIGSALRVRSRGVCMKPDRRSGWDVDASRAQWVGEFIEAPAGH